MSSTRSGIIYNKPNSNQKQSFIISQSSAGQRRSPRMHKATETQTIPTHQEFFAEPVIEKFSEGICSGEFDNERPKRTTSHRIPLDILREYLDEEDNDDSSDYEEDQNSEYEVNIDFDEASAAWRSNKLRRGESWIYKL